MPTFNKDRSKFTMKGMDFGTTSKTTGKTRRLTGKTKTTPKSKIYAGTANKESVYGGVGYEGGED